MKAQTYMVQAQLGNQFWDLYVTARCPKAAVAKARALVKGTAMDHRFTNFVV